MADKLQMALYIARTMNKIRDRQENVYEMTKRYRKLPKILLCIGYFIAQKVRGA